MVLILGILPLAKAFAPMTSEVAQAGAP
jgi:hypothetical protein